MTDQNINLKLENLKIEETISDPEFWGKLKCNVDDLKPTIEFILNEYGTKVPCNRFDVGNSIEHFFALHLKKNFTVKECPNAKRIDIDIQGYKSLSIKFSSTGDITLHNSNSKINNDIEMVDTLLLTPDKLYLLIKKELLEHNINFNNYLVNKGDSLKLKRSILTEIKKSNSYKYIYDINIKYNKDECKNKLCYKAFLKQVEREIEELNLNK
jgi:hypothetical protein